MTKKNIYTISFIIISVIVIFGIGLYSGMIIDSFGDSQGLLGINFQKSSNSEPNVQEDSVENVAIAKMRKTVLTFMPLSGTQKIGRAFEVKVVADVQDQRAQGVDIIVSYDPVFLELAPLEQTTQPSNGNLIVQQWEQGKIIFSYLAPGGTTWQQEVELANLKFTPLQAGQAVVKFDFNENSTSDCNVAFNGQDILERVYDARFRITAQ